MRISHFLQQKSFHSDVDHPVGGLLCSGNGGFFSLGICSRYRGLHCKLDHLYKILDSIEVDGNLHEITNFGSSLSTKQGDSEATYYIPHGSNALYYHTSQPTNINLLFDVKKPYDNRTLGRNYEVSSQGEITLITFTKKTHQDEDDSHDQKEYQVFIAIDTFGGSTTFSDEWLEQQYDHDKQRGSHPNSRYVFNALRIQGNSFLLSCAQSKEQAIDSLHTLKKGIAHYTPIQFLEYPTDTLQIASLCCRDALEKLIVHHHDINLYAGLPWFFQHWGRDTFISLKGLILDKHYNTAKEIFLSYLPYIKDGRLPNILPESEIGSADAIGWYWLRFDEFIQHLRSENLLFDYFSYEELRHFFSTLKQSIVSIAQHHLNDDLVVNKAQETWMDSAYKDDVRGGARIEIQALYLRMLDIAHRLCDDKTYQAHLEDQCRIVKESFWNGSYLKDGSNDDTLRSNIFLAYYIFPDLLEEEEWEQCFDSALSALWLDWGGVTTIDKNHPYYHERSTGETSDSYHRGDSWYWINNLTALCLYRLNKEKYQSYVDRIIEASTHDILELGYIGCHSEVSSACMQEAGGCLNQAWSNALFLELSFELFR